jgi:PAS domain S-box-containing protein
MAGAETTGLEAASPPRPRDSGFRTQLELRDRALAATAEGVTIADARLPDNPIIYANAGFVRLTGYSVEEVLGRNCRFLEGPDTDWETLEKLRAALREKHGCTVQLLNYRKDGTTFWNRLSITPVRDDSGRVTHFIGVQSDVTEQKLAEQALQTANNKLEAAGERMKRDLEAAAAVQRALLPAALPRIHGINLAWAFRPCQELAGDTLNVFPLDDRRIALYILDVSGHGVAASLLSVTLSRFLSPIPEQSVLYHPLGDIPGSYCVSSPGEVVARLNKQFPFEPRTAQYFTIFYGVLEVATRELRYVTAGQVSPVYMPAGGPPRTLQAGGVPVGLFPASNYEEQVLKMGSGDRLYLSTDGVIEAEDNDERGFGMGRLLEALERNRGVPLAESLTSVIASAQRWCAPSAFADDVSMLALEIRGADGQAHGIPIASPPTSRLP